MASEINKENLTGLTTEKKEILKSVMGSVDSPIDMNKMMEEMEVQEPERYCTIQESITESCKQIKLMREGKLPKRSWDDLKEAIQKIKDED